MPWYFVSGLSLIGFWVIGTVLVQIDEDYAIKWSVGLVWLVLWTVCYPIRAVMTYRRYAHQYRNAGISLLQYLLGARIYKKARKDS